MNLIYVCTQLHCIIITSLHYYSETDFVCSKVIDIHRNEAQIDEAKSLYVIEWHDCYPLCMLPGIVQLLNISTTTIFRQILTQLRH